MRQRIRFSVYADVDYEEIDPKMIRVHMLGTTDWVSQTDPLILASKELGNKIQNILEKEIPGETRVAISSYNPNH